MAGLAEIVAFDNGAVAVVNGKHVAVQDQIVGQEQLPSEDVVQQANALAFGHVKGAI